MLPEILSYAERMYTVVGPGLDKGVLVLVTLFTGFILGRIIDLLLEHALRSIKLDERLGSVFAKRRYATGIRRTIVRLVYVVTVIIALRELGVAAEAILVVAIILALILGASLVAGIVEFIPNVVARVEMRRLKPKQQIVVRTPQGSVTGAFLGFVLFDARVKRSDGVVFLVPVRALRTFIAR
jgi:hypothetical protein